jgi:uncharacterized protein
MNRSAQTALMVFSLSSRREAKRKRLFGSQKVGQEASFFQQLIGRTRSLAQASGLEVFWIDEPQQRGGSFGERLAGAFQQLFDQGYERVISIGNDCPELSVELLQQAVQRLEKNQPVLGPANDGGVYLIGMNRAQFDAGSFARLPWNTSRLGAALGQSLAAKVPKISYLVALHDIDDRPSLESFLETCPHHALAGVARQLLRPASGPFLSQPSLMLPGFLIAPAPLRGPPRR